MTDEENISTRPADGGRTFVRRSDGFDMGSGTELWIADDIGNYGERAVAETENVRKENISAQ